MEVKKTANALRDSALIKTVIEKHKVSKNTKDSAVHKAVKNVKKILEKKQSKETTAKSIKEGEIPISLKVAKSKKKQRKPLVSPKINKSKKEQATWSISSKVDNFEKEKGKLSFSPRIKKKIAKFRTNRGIVYLGHIPHGFYEEQMRDYFSQFGKVTKVRLVRSRNTGRSRGYGYIEFLHSDVAKIAAETMHNYFMCGRLLKTTYIPPEKQHRNYFLGTNWTRQMYPKLLNRKKINAIRNSEISDDSHKRYVKKSLRNLSRLEKKLKQNGLNLKFTPVDAPPESDKET